MKARRTFRQFLVICRDMFGDVDEVDDVSHAVMVRCITRGHNIEHLTQGDLLESPIVVRRRLVGEETPVHSQV